MTAATSLCSHSAQVLLPFSSALATSRDIRLVFEVTRWVNRLEFAFALSGRDAGSIVVPSALDSSRRRRRDELWKSTCLEIFVGPAEGESYVELNLAPSGDWNVYSFDSYRSGMRTVNEVEAPLQAVEKIQSETRRWRASLRAPSASEGQGPVGELLRARRLVLGATAVLEYNSGEREYWALKHAGEKPDFHLRASFQLPL